MNSLHYRIPEDFSLICLKNDATETLAFPEISTYTASNKELVVYLCEKIIARIEKSHTRTPGFSEGSR